MVCEVDEMAKFMVIQIGSQRDVPLGEVEASNAEEAHHLAYAEFGDPDDKGRSFSSFRVEATETITATDQALMLIDP